MKQSSTHPFLLTTTSYVKTQAMTVTNRSKEAKVKDDSKDGTINDAGQLVSAPGEYATSFHFRLVLFVLKPSHASLYLPNARRLPHAIRPKWHTALIKLETSTALAVAGSICTRACWGDRIQQRRDATPKK